MTTHRCSCCGVTGPDADDYEGMCVVCYDQRNADWFDGDVEDEDPTCPECGFEGIVPVDDVTWMTCPMCTGTGIIR